MRGAPTHPAKNKNAGQGDDRTRERAEEGQQDSAIVGSADVSGSIDVQALRCEGTVRVRVRLSSTSGTLYGTNTG